MYFINWSCPYQVLFLDLTDFSQFWKSRSSASRLWLKVTPFGPPALPSLLDSPPSSTHHSPCPAPAALEGVVCPAEWTVWDSVDSWFSAEGGLSGTGELGPAVEETILSHVGLAIATCALHVNTRCNSVQVYSIRLIRVPFQDVFMVIS